MQFKVMQVHIINWNGTHRAHASDNQKYRMHYSRELDETRDSYRYCCH